MDNNTELTNTGNGDNSGITSNNDNKDIRHENIEEETTASAQPHEEPPLDIISVPQNTTQQVSELPSNLNITAASKITSDVVVPTSTIGSNVAAHQKSKSRHRLSSSEPFINLEDNVSMRTYSDTMKGANRPRESRRSAPVPYRPTTEFDVHNLPRPNSQIILPTSMKGHSSIITPNSDQEFHMLARILNWPTQNHDHDKLQNLVGQSTKDNLVDDGEIIFDTTSFNNQASDIQQPSHGQIPSSSAQSQYIPQGRFSVTAAMHQVTNPSRAPEVPPLISTTYGTEIFDQIQSDDDPRLIVWSISRAEDRKQGSVISSVTNASSSKRWSIHEKLERAGKTICGSGLKDKKDNNRLASKNRNVMSEKVIMAATIEKLIEKLTSGIDYTFLTDFFLTYRTFITPLRLCNLLILRFDWALEGDDEQRKIVRVRTFVTLRHWLLNYFAYDFVPCRALRSTFISYLNTLHSNPLIRNSPRDQRIVQGLKRVIRRLKRIYYRKGVTGILKNGNGGFNGDGTGKKSSGKFKEMEETIPKQFSDIDVITVEHSGVGAGTSSKEKSKKTIKHESSSTLGSILTPGTTDSEDEEIDSLGLRQSSRSRISRPTEFRQSFEATSSNSQHSEDEFSLKRTYENPISSFYNVKLSKSLPTLTNEIVSDWERDVDDGSGIGSKENEKVPGLEKREEGAITKKKLKSRSSSMSDLSQRRTLQAEFNPLEQSLKENIIVEEEEPPPLPPRRSPHRRHRRHTFTHTQPTPASPPLPSFFKGGFLNFPTRKPKKIVTQETMNEKFQDRTRKKRSLSLSEAICGFAENDDDDDDDDEFDLSQIDHAGGIVRRNSSPAYIGSSSLRSEQQREKDETLRRRTGRPSWPQKMSATVGKFAKVLFTPGTGKPGGIKMLCANSEVVTTEEGESEGSIPNNFNVDEPIHVDGFSYVDESLEEEYYDTMRQEDFAGTEEQFNWDEPSDEDENEDELQDVEVMSLDDEGLASSTEPYPSPTSSSIQEQEKDDKNDKNNEDLEEQEISQSTRSIRRKAKVWGLGPVIEVDDDDNYYKSSLETSSVSELKKEEKMVQESSENKKAEELQSPRRNHRLAKVEEEGELNIVAEPPGNEEVLEQGIDIEEEEHDENNPSSHRLRRLPKVRDLRSVVTLKDLEEKSGKRVSWSTFSSLGTLGIEDTGTTEAILSRALTSSSSSKLKHKESVKSSPKVETETQGGSKEFEQEPAKRKDKSIMKPPSSEPVASSSIIPGSPKKSSESSVKRIVITEPPSKKLPDIPVQHTTTTNAEPSSSSQIPLKNIPSTTQKSSLNKPLPPLPIQSRKPPSISTTLNSQSPYRSFILNYRSEDIAKQFCLIERDLLLKVNWEDLVQVGYTNGKDAENVQNFESEEKKKDIKDIKDIKGKGKEKEVEKEEKKVFKGKSKKRENGVDKVIERFNLTCDWVATEIVLTRSLEDRVRLIEKFIRVAQKCLQFSNFATLTQILLGLQSPPIERLRRTWTRIRNEDLRVLKELNEYISHFGNWKVIREAMRKSIDDSTILKELIKQRKRRGSDVRKINTGCIPFLGLYLSDLVFNAAVPSFIDPTPPSQPPTPSSPLSSSSADAATTPLYHQQPLINFHKHRTTATIVKRVLTFQNLSREYNFSIDKEIYDKCFGLKGLEATKLVVMDLDVDDFV